MKRDDTRHWFLQHLALGQIWNKTSLVSLLNPSSRSVSALLRFKWNMRQRTKIIILQNWWAHNKVLLSADGNWHFCPNTMEKNTTDKIVSYKGRPHFPRGALSNTRLLKTQQWCSSDSFGVHTEEQKRFCSMRHTVIRMWFYSVMPQLPHLSCTGKKRHASQNSKVVFLVSPCAQHVCRCSSEDLPG